MPKSGVTVYALGGLVVDPQEVGTLYLLRLVGARPADLHAFPALAELYRLLLIVLGEAGFTVLFEPGREAVC